MRILLATDGNLERQGICMFMLQWVRTVRTVLGDNGEIVVYFRKSIKDLNLKEGFLKVGVELASSDLPDSGTMQNASLRKKVSDDLHALMTERHFDVIHINSSAKGFTTIVLKEAIRAGVPIRISHTHGRHYDSIFKQIYTYLFRLYILHGATLLAGCSVDAGLYMFGRAAVGSNKWHFVPNTIDTEKYAFDETARMQCRNELKLSPDTVLIGSVGLLEAYKNHIFLLDLVQDLRSKGKMIVLVIFGEGSLLPILKEKVTSMELSEQVVLYGESPNISKWLSSLDYYVMPSLIEGLPIAAVEAQANGLPCLLSDHIPADVDLSPDVYHLPIDKGPEPWSQKLMSLPKKSAQERRNGVVNVRRAGFDAESLANHVRYLYGIQAQ